MALETVVGGLNRITEGAQGSGVGLDNFLNTGIPIWVVVLFGALFSVFGIAYSWESLNVTGMESGRATTVFQGSAAIGGFLGLTIASSKLDDLGRPIHLLEMLPAAGFSALAGAFATLLLLPPDPWIPQPHQAITRVIDVPQ